MKKPTLIVLMLALLAAVVWRLRAEPGQEEVVPQRSLDSMTRDELYELAREQGIPGRSRMKKTELRAALSRAGRSG
jgi:Rho termination factor, N-terminal domain